MSDLAEFAFTAFRGVKRDDMVANFDVCDTLTDRFDNSSSFVSADYGKGAFGILAGESVSISMADLKLARHISTFYGRHNLSTIFRIKDTYTSPKDLDTDFMGLWRGNFDIFDRQLPASFPSNGRLPRN